MPDSLMNPDRVIEDACRAAVDRAITSRRSVRAFRDTPVPRSVVEDILRVAARAPSGTNTQPWQVYVLMGAPLRELILELSDAFDAPGWSEQHREEYDYYPSKWKSPFIDRRRKVGWDLYSLLGIGREDKAAMHAQHRRNYGFFGAPVGLMFTIDRSLGRGSWLDYGMFLQNIMVAARGRGLDTCPQAAFTPFHRLIGERLALPADEMLICGMALGYADESDVSARLVTEREPVEGFVRFIG
jgi:nitroreductase